MKPGAQRRARGRAPTARPPAKPLPVNPLAAPEFMTLRQVRAELAKGGMLAQRTPEDHARIAAFRTIEEFLRFVEEYRRRIPSGERCKLVERPHKSETGRVMLEFEIEAER